MENTSELILNPSFVVPALYCSIVFNIFMIFIFFRLLGPLRKVLKRLGEDSSIILNINKEDNLNIEDESTHIKQNIDKKEEDLF